MTSLNPSDKEKRSGASLRETGSRASTGPVPRPGPAGFDPARIRLSRRKGWRIPASAVNVARPGKWGNPFVVGKDGTREQCVALFAQLTRGFIDLGGRLSVDEQLTYYRRVRRSLDDLKGCDLACWCALDGKPCHADVLLSLANGTALPAWAKQPIDIGRVRLGMAAWDLNKARRNLAASVDRSGEAAKTAQQGLAEGESAVPEGQTPTPGSQGQVP